MSDKSNTYAELADSVAGAVATAQMMEALINAGTVGEMENGADRKRARKFYELGDEADFSEALENIALEVYANARIDPGSEPEIEEIVTVTGTGGPHIEFSVNANGDVKAEGWWGTDHVTLRAGGEAPALFEYLEGYFA